MWRTHFAAAACLMALAAGTRAAVVPVDLNGDSVYEAFLDDEADLLWTNANVFGARLYASALSAVDAATIEGITDWRIPTRAEFDLLYATQGSDAAGLMTASPFTGMQSTWYWTTDLDPGNSLRHVAFSPSGNLSNFFFTTTPVNVWAVRAQADHTVPEPGTVALLAPGLLALLGRSRSRGA